LWKHLFLHQVLALVSVLAPTAFLDYLRNSRVLCNSCVFLHAPLCVFCNSSGLLQPLRLLQQFWLSCEQSRFCANPGFFAADLVYSSGFRQQHAFSARVLFFCNCPVVILGRLFLNIDFRHFCKKQRKNARKDCFKIPLDFQYLLFAISLYIKSKTNNIK